MKDKYFNIAQDILQRADFERDYKVLFENYVFRIIGDDYKEPSIHIGLRLSKAAQILIASAHDEYIEIGSKILDMFMAINPSYLEDILVIAENVFINLGDLPNLKLLNDNWRHRNKISLGLSRILEEEMHKHINTIESLGIAATNFQIDLWNNLNDGSDLVTIAPTSTGKSHIIIQYLIESINASPNDKTYAIYIVPSRALIYEVSKKIQNLLSEKGIMNVDVATIAQREKAYDQKTIFILTQERMLMLLNFQLLMRFSYIVVDEAQSISEGTRGVLLHIVLSNAMARGSVQLIFSTPSHDYINTFNFLLGKQSVPHCTTGHSPVSKNHIFVRCQASNLILRSKNPEIAISIPKKFQGVNYDEIVSRLGANSVNLVYVNTPSDCQKMVEKLLVHVRTDKKELLDASDYIRKTVHEKFSLADAIKKGIVFHYGPLPRNIRIMIEAYVNEKLIDYVVCTSTLAEGVNLPARNLFIKDPKIVKGRGRPSEPMSIVQYENIIGRAGRLMKHFSGNIFYVNYDKWEHREALEKKSEEHQLPTYYKILKENTEDLIHSLQGKNNTDPEYQRTLNATANKILQDEQEGKLQNILDIYVETQKRQKILDAINNLHKTNEISAAILNLNPTIGIVQQNRLYRHLDDLRDNAFVLLKPLMPYDNEFFCYLIRLVSLLNDFDIIHLNFRGDDSEVRHKYIYKICKIAEKWIKGIPLKMIIEGSIRGSSSIDTQIREIVKLIDNMIRFRLANAIKCFCDIYTLIASQRDLDYGIVDFYSFLEVGACTKQMIRLISLGFSRQTAIEIVELMKDIDPDSKDIIQQVKGSRKYLQLHKITRKEIESLNI